MSETRALVTGAGGFIGHHLCSYLAKKGYWVRGVDQKPPEYSESNSQDFVIVDLRDQHNCLAVVEGVDEVYHLAADMGGIGFIGDANAEIARNNATIDIAMLQAARLKAIKRFLFSSTACVYPLHLQQTPDVTPLKEAAAWPAQPEEGYGLEKLFTEKLCEYYSRDFGIPTRIARLHNVYGPLGTYDGGREKAPAAISRKVARIADAGEIEVWGDGRQTRSFMYIDDCVEGIHRIMRSEDSAPFNLGTEEMVTINNLVEIVAAIAGKRVTTRHNLSKPQGVRGRNSDNSRLRGVLGWEPKISLREGMKPTYAWIEAQVLAGRSRTEN